MERAPKPSSSEEWGGYGCCGEIDAPGLSAVPYEGWWEAVWEGVEPGR